MIKRVIAGPLAVALALAFGGIARADEAAQELVRKIDEQMTLTSDFQGLALIREKRADGTESVAELMVYRRDSTGDLLMLVANPPSIAGTGFLRIDNNLWYYSAIAGRWERRTQRADILGTLSCQSDFDRPRLSLDYEAVEEAPEVVNGVKYRKLYLTAKKGIEVVFPFLRLWVDPDLKIVKRIGYAPSGKPLRSDLIRSYQRLKDPKTGRETLYYREVIETQAELGAWNTVRYEQISLADLPPSIFTKAWLEGRTRR